MPKVNEAVVNCARKVGGGAVVMSMLSAETPAAGLPEGAFFDPMTRIVVVALETVQERERGSPTSFTKHCTAIQIVFPFFHIGWSLSGKDAWDPIIMGGKKEGRGGRGACGEEVLLETSLYCAGGQTSFYHK